MECISPFKKQQKAYDFVWNIHNGFLPIKCYHTVLHLMKSQYYTNLVVPYSKFIMYYILYKCNRPQRDLISSVHCSQLIHASHSPKPFISNSVTHFPLFYLQYMSDSKVYINAEINIQYATKIAHISLIVTFNCSEKG